MKEQKILSGYTVFEGLDGAGTTTQALLLADRCKLKGKAVQLTFEPTASEIGVVIRKVLAGQLPYHPETLARLFVADRYEHLFGKGGILSWLDKHIAVIGDRYLFSSLAYQSLDVDFDIVYEINSMFPLPERLIYIDLAPEECERRMSDRDQRDIFETLALQKRVRERYEHTLDRYAKSGMKIHRLDGALAKEELAEKVWSIVRDGR